VDYDYYELTVGRAPDAQRTAAAAIGKALGKACVACWSPVLGFATNQLLVLTERGATATGVLSAPAVIGGVSTRLTPTLRPADGTRPEPMGVYVHRWFTIDGPVEEFVRLSGEAWPDFEGHFVTKVYGLFLAEASEADRHEGARRLLLVTGYRDLEEWQKSRQPAPTARQAFQRRQELTRVSLARACTLIPGAHA
jgi:hypothetical protein